MLIIAAASLLLVVWGLFTLDWYKVGLGIFIFLACFAVDLYKKRAVLTDDKLAAAHRYLIEVIRIIKASLKATGIDAREEKAIIAQSLFYMGQTQLKHKILAIAEEEGAARASYALKLLQSEGELTIASTGKDPVSGNLITQQYRVEGPVALLVTTTARDIDEELMNRCLVLAVDEGREQTRAIHQLQRDKRTLEGLLARREKEARLP